MIILLETTEADFEAVVAAEVASRRTLKTKMGSATALNLNFMLALQIDLSCRGLYIRVDTFLRTGWRVKEGSG